MEEWFTPPETNSSPLKMDGLNTSFLLGWPFFGGYVSFRECIPLLPTIFIYTYLGFEDGVKLLFSQVMAVCRPPVRGNLGEKS